MNFVLSASAPSPRSLDERIDFVEKIARQLARRLPSHVDLADLCQEGLLALSEISARPQCVESDPGFRSYLTARVKGSMLDLMRRLDWTSRGSRRRTRELRKAEDRLQQALGRDPSTAELANYTGLEAKLLRRQQVESRYATVLSLEELTSRGIERKGAEADETCKSLDRHCLGEHLDRLPERERAILILHYFEDCKLGDLAVAMGISQARLSQLHKQALQRLKLSMAPSAKGPARKPFERLAFTPPPLKGRISSLRSRSQAVISGA